MRPRFSPCDESTIAPMRAGATAKRFTKRQLFATYGTADPLHSDRRVSIHQGRTRERGLKCCSLCIDSSAYTALMVMHVVCPGFSLGSLNLKTQSQPSTEKPVFSTGTSHMISWLCLCHYSAWKMTTTSMIFIYYVLDTLAADGNFNSFFGWFYV